MYIIFIVQSWVWDKTQVYKKISVVFRDEASPWVCEAVKGVELSGPASSSLLDNLAKKVIFNFSIFFLQLKNPQNFLYSSSEYIFYSSKLLIVCSAKRV